MSIAAGDETWVHTQQKTFTKWMNNHLQKKQYPPITDAANDFDTGIKLMQIINALYDVPIPKHNAKPKMRPHALDNIEQALKMLDQAKIKTNFLKPTHLIDHDLKMILGMMWAIILDYAIKGIKDEETDVNAKEGLLLWCRKKTAGYRDVDPPSITNFTSNWKSGLAFCALIHRHQPHLIDYDSLDKSNAAANLELAFATAEKLGIPRLIDVEDLLQEKPDERSVMTQVAEYYSRFVSQSGKEVAARRAANFLAFTKSMDQLKHSYEERARDLLQWTHSTIERFNSADMGTTLEDSLALLAALRSFVLSEKGERNAAKLDLESLYAEIQTQLRINARPAYVAPKEYAPDTIDAAFDDLYEAEKRHASAVRARRFKFVHKKETGGVGADKVQEFTETFKAFNKDGSAVLDKPEFKAALSAMSIPVKDDAALDALYKQVSAGDANGVTLDAWVKWNTDRETDRDTPEQVKQSFAQLADNKPTISLDALRANLSAEDVEYLQSAMPQAADGGLDYSAFVDSSFLTAEQLAETPHGLGHTPSASISKTPASVDSDPAPTIASRPAPPNKPAPARPDSATVKKEEEPAASTASIEAEVVEPTKVEEPTTSAATEEESSSVQPEISPASGLAESPKVEEPKIEETKTPEPAVEDAPTKVEEPQTTTESSEQSLTVPEQQPESSPKSAAAIFGDEE